MLNLRKRIKELQSRTTSSEAKDICRELIENFINVPEYQLATALVEKLKSIEDTDKHVTKFIHVSEKIQAVTDLGIAKYISKLKESQIYSYPALTYGLSKIEHSLINAQTPEYMLIDKMIECIKTFVWDATVESIYNELKEKRNLLEESIAICISLYEFSSARGNFIYDSIITKIEDHFENPTESSRSSILEDLKKFSYTQPARILAESLTKIQRSEKGGIQIISENSNCSVSSIYSPVLLENANEYFFIKGNFYSKTDGKITKVVEENVKSLPAKFKDICRIISDPNVFIKEGKISFYLKRNKVEILENENKVEVLFNGSKVSSTELAKNMVSAGLFRLEEAQIAYDVQSLAESFSNIYDLDFGKIIESNVNKGAYVILMKEKDNIYLNKVNENNRTNEFYSNLTATKARNMVLEFIGFDIKESLSEYLEKDEIVIKEYRDSQLEIMKNIAIVESNLEKINSNLQDSFLSSSTELLSLKSMLEAEILKLKLQHREFNSKIKAFEEKTSSDAGFDVGDEVKIIETGETATVSSIDSSRDIVNVVKSNGDSAEVKTNGITSVEDDIEQAAEKNVEDTKPEEGEEGGSGEHSEEESEENKKKA